MKAILVPAGAMSRAIELEGLKDLQRAVGGCIEACAWVFNDRPTVYVNDEGKFACEPNRAIYATAEDEGAIRWDGSTVKRGDLLEILFGDFVCVSFDEETGEHRDITEAEAARVMERFGTARSIDSGIVEVLRIQLGTAAERL